MISTSLYRKQEETLIGTKNPSYFCPSQLCWCSGFY